MKYFKFLSFVLALALTANFAVLPMLSNPNYGIATCEENPCDFIFNDD